MIVNLPINLIQVVFVGHGAGINEGRCIVLEGQVTHPPEGAYVRVDGVEGYASLGTWNYENGAGSVTIRLSETRNER